MTNEMTKVSVKQNEKNPVPVEILATSIRAIAEGIKVLRKGPLGEKALLILISENCVRKGLNGYPVKAKISLSTLKSVLNSLESLQSMYLK